VPSPTYTYYHLYENIVHVDLYRAKSYEDIIQIGLDELFEDDTKIFLIEWPEVLIGHIDPSYSLRLTHTANDDIRNLEIENHWDVSLTF